MCSRELALFIRVLNCDLSAFIVSEVIIHVAIELIVILLVIKVLIVS